MPASFADPAWRTSDTLALYDRAVPEQPTRHGHLRLPSPVSAVRATGELAVAIEDKGWRRLFVIDGSDLERPRLVGDLRLRQYGPRWRRLVLPRVVRDSPSHGRFAPDTTVPPALEVE
jgi:hypothetical protein